MQKDIALQQQADQFAALATDNLRLSNRVAQARDAQLISQEQLNDLLKLRSEVGALKAQLADAAKIQARVTVARATIGAAAG